MKLPKPYAWIWAEERFGKHVTRLSVDPVEFGKALILQEEAEQYAQEAVKAALAEQAARIQELEKDAKRYRWLRDHKCNSLLLSRDDHASNYVSASEWIDQTRDWYDEVPAEELQRMRDENTIWALQIYPDTPIGFCWWHGASLDAAIDAAIASSEGQGAA